MPHETTTTGQVERGGVTRELRDRIRAIENRLDGPAAGAYGETGDAPDAPAAAIATGWEAVDALLARAVRQSAGGLRRGVVHEFFTAPLGRETSTCPAPASRSAAPLCCFAHLARCALAAARPGETPFVLWVGRSCRLNPDLLMPPDDLDRRLLECSIFLDPPDLPHRLRALDLALRAPGCLVFAEGWGLDIAATRRLQLAAEAGRSACFLSRPMEERSQLSVAATRWLLEPIIGEHAENRAADDVFTSGSGGASDAANADVFTSGGGGGGVLPRWRLQLLRCKGLAFAEADHPHWDLEWDHAAHRLHLSAALADRASATPFALERAASESTAEAARLDRNEAPPDDAQRRPPGRRPHPHARRKASRRCCHPPRFASGDPAGIEPGPRPGPAAARSA